MAYDHIYVKPKNRQTHSKKSLNSDYLLVGRSLKWAERRGSWVLVIFYLLIRMEVTWVNSLRKNESSCVLVVYAYFCKLFSSGSQLRVILLSRGHLAISGEILGCHIWESIKTSNGYTSRPGMLLNIVAYTAQPPKAKNHLYINKNECSI